MNARRSNRGRWLSIAIIMVFAAAMLAASIAPALAATAITDCMDLQNMRNNLSGDYYLANDIDCSDTSGGVGFEPIGTSSNKFTGTFDGNGYKITGLYINRGYNSYASLFGFIGSGSEITDVGLEQVSITGDFYVGSLVGKNDGGQIANCYSTGGVRGYLSVGGLVGENDGPITNCYSTGGVAGSYLVGGLVGKNLGPVFTRAQYAFPDDS